MQKGLCEGKVCLVTGAGRGIGQAIAQRLSRECGIVCAADIQGETLQEWVTHHNKEALVPIVPCVLDVTDSAAVKNTVSEMRKKYGRLDVLVNNAAIITYELLGMVSKDVMRRMFEVNVFAVVELMQYASRIMSRQKSGSIINMASIVGVNGASGQLSYAASKGAVIAATKSAAKEMAPYGVRVNAIAPGMVDTERFHAVLTKHFAQRTECIGMGRLADTEDIAEACLFFASDQSRYITGQVLGVDGSTIL